MVNVEAVRETGRPIDFDQMLADLAERMRQYDALSASKEGLLDAKEVVDAQLEGLDIDLPSDRHPEFVARHALEKVILDRRIEAIDQELLPHRRHDIDSLHLLLVQGLEGRKVEIRPTDPERYKLIKLNGEGDSLIYSGFTNQPKKGKVKDIDLDPFQGGCLKIHGRFYSYEARGLIDRDNDYAPAFVIRYLE